MSRFDALSFLASAAAHGPLSDDGYLPITLYDDSSFRLWTAGGAAEIGLASARPNFPKHIAIWRIEDRTGEELISHPEDALALLGLMADGNREGTANKMLCAEDGVAGAAELVAEIASIVAAHAPADAPGDAVLLVVGPTGARVPATEEDGLGNTRARCLTACRRVGAYGWQLRDTGEVVMKVGQGGVSLVTIEPIPVTVADVRAAAVELQAIPVAA